MLNTKKSRYHAIKLNPRAFMRQDVSEPRWRGGWPNETEILAAGKHSQFHIIKNKFCNQLQWSLCFILFVIHEDIKHSERNWVLSIQRKFRKFRVEIQWNRIFSGKDFRKFRTTFSVCPKSENFGIFEKFAFHSWNSDSNFPPVPAHHNIFEEDNMATSGQCLSVYRVWMTPELLLNHGC